jgi:chemotaxis protein histidine kinase CheA
VRAITTQPSRQLSTLRPITSRVTLLDSAKPALYRSFHQTRIWRAEEEEKKAEELKDEAASAATAAEEAAEIAQEAADEAVVQAAAEPAAQEAIDVSSSATAAAQTAAAAASTAQSAAAAAPSPLQPPQRSAEFPPRQATPSSFANPSPTPILYIGNLFFEVTVQQLEQEFSHYGRIVNTRIVSDARGLSKGFGYVEFESQEAADRAVRELDQKVFQGRRMAVQYHVRREPRNRTVGGTGRTPNTPSKTLFIGNMSYQMSDRDLNGKRAWPTIYT